MANVPLVKNIRISKIREIINNKAVLLANVISRGTSFGRYGADHYTGFIYITVRNVSSGTVSGTVNVQVTGPDSYNQTTAVSVGAAGSQVAASFNGLRQGNYTVKLTNGSQTDTVTIKIKNRNRLVNLLKTKTAQPTTNISIGQTTISNTSNLLVADDLNTPSPLPGSVVDHGLGDFKGAMVLSFSTLEISTGSARYGADNHSGRLKIFFDAIGKGSAGVQVSIVNRATKVLKNTGSALQFDGLSKGTYKVRVLDIATRNALSFNINIKKTGYRKNKKYRGRSFDGTDRIATAELEG